MRRVIACAVLFLALPGWAAERFFNFRDYSPGQPPEGFRSTVAGAGKPGDWKVITDDTELPATGASDHAAATRGFPVLGQLAREPLDTHFPILVYEGETFKDFTLTTRFKIVGGALEQMAGVVFRFQNESNFYVVRASVLGRNFRCYKVENGLLKPALGPELKVTKGVWHHLTVQCEGSRILCALDGNEAIKLVDNSSKAAGKIGFWTKSDSIAHFGETRITYTPQQILAQSLVNAALKEYPRLLGLQMHATRPGTTHPEVVASGDAKDLRQPAGQAEQDVIANGTSYFSRGKGSVTVTLPLRDRNGEPMAAVRVVMKSFPGQTEDNAVVRAQPILKMMQGRAQSREELLE